MSETRSGKEIYCQSLSPNAAFYCVNSWCLFQKDEMLCDISHILNKIHLYSVLADR